MRVRAAVLALVLLGGGLTGCSAADPTIEGIVVDVQGDLTQVDRFTVLDSTGDLVTFVPAPDVRFHDGAPLSHLSEHLRNGEPIAVTYRELADGSLAAMRVEDVG